MSARGWVLGGAAALGLAWGATELIKTDLPEGCFKSNADNKLYVVKDGKAAQANAVWTLAEDGKSCFQREGGGSFVSIPVIQYP